MRLHEINYLRDSLEYNLEYDLGNILGNILNKHVKEWQDATVQQQHYN